MIPVLLILIPVVTGLFGFFQKEASAAKNWALLSSVITLAVAVTGIFFLPASNLAYDAAWLPDLGSRFSLQTDGMGKMLVLLTTISFPLIFVATYKNEYKNPGSFYGLMLLSQAGLLGVFVAADALVFYFFWELALIPLFSLFFMGW